MQLLTRFIFLAVVWAALQGSFTLVNLLMGGLFGGLVLWFVHPTHGGAKALRASFRGRTVRWQLRRLWWVTVLLFVFLWELVKSSMTVAIAVLRPRMRIKPGVVALPLDAKSDLEITLLANLISLTPGTLSLDVSSDRETLYIHSMFLDNEEAKEVRRQIKSRLEHHVIRAIGRSEGPG